MYRADNRLQLQLGPTEFGRAPITVQTSLEPNAVLLSVADLWCGHAAGRCALKKKAENSS